MTKDHIGRNEPCSCGSGKKYKKCCLANIVVPVDFAWRRLRQLEGKVVDQLLPYVMKKLPSVVLETARSEIYPEKLPEEIDEELLFSHFFLPWFIFSWIPKADFGLEKFLPGQPLALQYINQYGSKLTQEEKSFIQILCDSHYSFFSILNVEPGQFLEIKDIILGDHYHIKEKMGSQILSRGDIVFSRVLTMGDQSIFIGMAPFIVPAPSHGGLLLLRDEITKISQKKLSKKLIRVEFEDVLINCFFMILKDFYNNKTPTFANTDGDLFQSCKAYFTLNISPKQAFMKLLSLTLSDDPDEFLQDATKNTKGEIMRVEFPWLRLGNALHKEWDNTVMGHFKIKGNKLILETNSEPRIKKGTELIRKYLQGDAVYQKMMLESVGQKMKTLPTKGQGFEDKSSDLLNLPEVKQKMQEMMQSHWEHWFDKPIPMLLNQTPREASKTKEGRERLEALLLVYERTDLKNKNELTRANIPYLREELGLSEEMSC